MYESKLVTEMSSNLLIAALQDAIDCDDVITEVDRNYYNNVWWPLEVADWRLRMLVAGWSTRVSYNHIAHYAGVVQRVAALGWEGLGDLPDVEVRALVRPIGLPDARLRYLRSLRQYLEGRVEAEVLDFSNESLIEDVASNVEGAGYKVAQCAVLYAKGYHCGIIPIDSGLVEMLEPLFPGRLDQSPRSHEIVRRWIERLVDCNRAEIHGLARHIGFDLDLSPDISPTWWVHLLLIYYKRLIWNKGIERGPFRRAKWVRNRTEVEESDSAGWEVGARSVRRVILEGPDGAGKSTLARMLEAGGYEVHHFEYSKSPAIFDRHKQALINRGDYVVLDRSFFSESANGPVRRDYSRLSCGEFERLVGIANVEGFLCVFLEEPLEVLSSRRPGEDPSTLRRLTSEYRALVVALESRVATYHLRSSQLSADGFMCLMGLTRRETIDESDALADAAPPT